MWGYRELGIPNLMRTWSMYWFLSKMIYKFLELFFLKLLFVKIGFLKGVRMGRSDTVSLWCVSLLINTRFRFFILE